MTNPPLNFSPDNPFANKAKQVALPQTALSADNPYLHDLPEDAGQNHVEDNGFFHTVGTFLNNLPDYLNSPGGRLLSSFMSGGAKFDPNLVNDIKQQAALKFQASQQAGQDIVNNFTSLYKRPISEVLKTYGEYGEDALKGLGNAGDGSFFSGLFKGFVQQPLEAITGTTLNQSGTVVGATPEEQAQSMLGVAGTVASIVAFKNIKASMLPEIGSVEDAVAANKVSTIGRLTLSPAFKQAGKYIAAEVTAGAGAGAAQGLINSAASGDPEAISAGLLTFMPLSAAMAAFGVRGYIRGVGEQVRKTLAGSNVGSAQELAALVSLRQSASDPISKLISGISATTSSDNLVKAAIAAKLNIGDGYITEGVSAGLVNELNLNISSTKNVTTEPIVGKGMTRLYLNNGVLSEDRPTGQTKYYDVTGKLAGDIKGQAPPEGLNGGDLNVGDNHYQPIRQVNNSRPRPWGTEWKFDSPFDKLAYLVRSKKVKLSPAMQTALADAVEQTGLSEEDIRAHGDYIQQQINKQRLTATPIPRTQSEIDAYNQSSISNGQRKILDSNPNGGQLEDNTGRVWTRNGQFLQSNGESRPIDNIETQQIVGRAKNDSPFFQPYLQLPTQEFHPEFGRSTPDIGANYYYSPANKSLLVLPKSVKLNEQTIAGFHNTGYLPGEIVSWGGKEYIVNGGSKDFLNVTDASTGKPAEVSTINVRRTNESITPLVKDFSGTKGVAAGTLNPTSFLDELYKKFYSAYQDAPEDQPYAAFSQKFFHDNGISEKDNTRVQSYFLSRLSDSLANDTLAPDELASYKKLNNTIIDYDNERTLDKMNQLANASWSNNLFFSAEGGGKYRLRFQDTGETYKIVGSPDEALQEINKIGQVTGLDKDGGNGNVLPPGIGNPGGLTEKYKAQYNPLQLRIDLGRIGGRILPWFTPTWRRMNALDNVSSHFGTPTDFNKAFLDIQNVLMKRRVLMENDPGVKSLMDNANKVLAMGAGLKSEERLLAHDNLDANSIDDVKNRFIGRPANEAEIGFANEIAKRGNVDKVSDLLYKARILSGQGIGTPTFMDSVRQLEGNYVPKVRESAQLLIQAMNARPDLSGPLMLELAGKLESPELAIDRITHERKYLNSKLIPYRNAVEAWYRQAAAVAGISPGQASQLYLPSIIRNIASSKGDLPVNIDLAKEISRAGIVPGDLVERDPNRLISRYFTALVNYKSGLSDGLKAFQDGLEKNYQVLENNSKLGPDFTTKLRAELAGYVNELRGYPTPTDSLTGATERVMRALGMKTFNPNSLVSLMSLGSIAGRPALALRDFHNITGAAWTSFGNEFLNRFLGHSVNGELVKALQDRGKIPMSNARQIIDPSLEETNLIQGKMLGIPVGKMSEKGFSISGQEWTYEHANAAIWQASMDHAEKYFGMLKDQRISKAEAFDRMGISSNYGPGLIGQIDDLLQNGKTIDAAELYATSNMRYLSHVYGFHNNPKGWSTNFGRLLGQWGSWNANASQTFLDQVSTGTKKQIAAKVLRARIWNNATTLVGAGMGMNLVGWSISNPLTVFPGTGPLVNIMETLGDNFERGVSPYSELWYEAQNFIPYGRAANGWLRMLGDIGDGNVGRGLERGLGFPLLPGSK